MKNVSLNRDAARSEKGTSLLQQWLLATLLSMAPLVVAVSYAVWELDRQSSLQSQQIQRQASLGQFAALIAKQSEDIERLSRQYRLLKERRFLLLLEIKWYQLEKTLLEVTVILPTDVASATETLRTTLRESLKSIYEGTTSATEAQIEGNYRAARTANTELQEAISAAVDAVLAETRNTFEKARWRILTTGGLALPATLLILIVSSTLISRSLKSLSHAIQQLGKGEWSPPISISGPADFSELGRRLEWMRQALQDVDEQKSRLTRHITHELKSPLTGIIDANELLRDEIPGTLSGTQGQVLQIQFAQAQQLRELIMKLLNFNEARNLVGTETASLNVREMCERLLSRYASIEVNDQPDFYCEGSFEIVESYPGVIEMILSNLLSNAFYFCHKGNRVDVSWWKDGSYWWLAVKDDGPGIPQEEQMLVFRVFEQGGNQRRGSLKGSGLGLAIVNESAQSIGARVYLESEVGHGSEFRVKIPLLNKLESRDTALTVEVSRNA